ncbi:MAG TPA: TonB family protein, partial [Thermoanaerobaculia bacterium]|nr:TonB family protein [Thermoanaerobaculia bacterium]
PAVQEPEPAPAEPRPAGTPPETAAPQNNPAPAVTTPAPVPEKTEPAQTRPQATAPAPVQPARPQIQYGDLAPAGTPGVTPPKLKGRLDPRYPSAAQRLNKAAVVDIRVLVNEQGKVLDAQRGGAKAGFGFDEAALEAARRATFTPASTKDGVKVKMWTVLRVSFQPGR